MAAHTLALLAGAVAVGAGFGLAVLPAVVPALGRSLSGPEPTAPWYLARSSGFVAFVLLWASMLAGLGISTRLSRAWPGARAAFDLHQHFALAGLGFALFHALVLLGDRYVGFRWFDLLLPFASRSAPAWTGLGQLALYAGVVVAVSFHLKRDLGQSAWRAIHFASFAVFVLALAHGLGAGSDSDVAWVRLLYVVAAASVLFLTLVRALGALVRAPAATRAAPPRRA